MPKKFLQTPSLYSIDYHRVGGWWLSERLKSFQCFWDGGVSRGAGLIDVPWANNRGVDGRPKKLMNDFATGLWTSNGIPIYAPDCFLDELPEVFLVGDLWSDGPGGRTRCYQAALRPKPFKHEWGQISLACYGVPPLDVFFSQRDIADKSFNKTINFEACKSFFNEYNSSKGQNFKYLKKDAAFDTELFLMARLLETNRVAFTIPQIRLNQSHTHAAGAVLDWAKKNPAKSALLRSPLSMWTPIVTTSCLYFDGVK